MISMMYLVLTALLALNVSKEILDAFVIVNDGLTATTENFNKKNQATYDEFNKQYELSKEKVGPWKDKAFKVKEEADKLFNRFEELKYEILTTAGEDEAMKEEDGRKFIDGMAIGKKDNADVPAQIMITAGKGKELMEMMKGFREFLVGMVKEDGGDQVLINGIEQFLNTDEHKDLKTGEVHPWESYHFEHLPLMAVLTIMSKMQGDVRNAEANTINFLMSKISGEDIPFNAIKPMVYAEANDIVSGGDYKAEIFIAAYDSTAKPKVWIGAYDSVTHDVKEGEGFWLSDSSIVDGKGIYHLKSPSVGQYNYKGFIRLSTPKGNLNYDFKAGYRIVPPSATVSATKMNVLYIGVDNPIKVSAPGVQADQVNATLAGNGSLTPRGNGEYIARVRGGTTCKINVSATIDGRATSMGSMDFRIKKIPNPTGGAVGQTSGGRAPMNAFRPGAFVFARNDPNFEFEANFNVTRFQVRVDDKGNTITKPANGNKITAEQFAAIQKLRPGGTVVFEKIVAVGPDGDPRNLPPVVITIQ